MYNSGVPPIPPLAGVTDYSTRVVLQAIVDQLDIRNGAVGDGSARFVTAAEMPKVTAPTDSLAATVSRVVTQVEATQAAQQSFQQQVAATGYSSATLANDLRNGVASVVAGVGSDYRLVVDSVNAMLVIGHKDMVYMGQAAPGINRPAIGLTATGLAMGYNRASDGAWVDSIVIEAATGNATFSGTVYATDGIFSGTVKAGAFIEGGVNIALLNDTEISFDDLTALATSAFRGAKSANEDLANKLSEGAAYIMDGSFALKTPEFDAGTGLALTSNGLVAQKGGSVMFALDTLGNASYAGTVSAAQITSGTLAAEVNLATQGYVRAYGNYDSDATYIGQYGNVTGHFSMVGGADPTQWDVGVWGQVTGTGSAVGRIGVIGIADQTDGFGIVGASALGTALYASGKLEVTGTSIFHGAVTAPNLPLPTGDVNTTKTLYTNEQVYKVPVVWNGLSCFVGITLV